jgi:hypothetical protein
VIVPAGVLTGQPDEQPGFVLAVDIERDATSRDRVKADEALPPRAARGELQRCSGDINVGSAFGAAARWPGGVPQLVIAVSAVYTLFVGTPASCRAPV